MARRCNVKCIFCDHTLGSSCHTSRPGISAQVMIPDEALDVFVRESTRTTNLRIVAVSGPGEPLANQDTFTVLSRIREKNKEIKFCLSTNGVLLHKYVPELVNLDVQTISVSLHGVVPTTVQEIYEWAIIDSKVLYGIEMAEVVLERQLEGIRDAIDAGIYVKVNTVLMPSINSREIEKIAAKIAKMGVPLHNIVPLVPSGKLQFTTGPSPEELQQARNASSKHVSQFYHCAQCRSDVVGIPGSDRVL